MNVEIGTEAMQFPEKEYINGIFLALKTERTEGKVLQRIQNRKRIITIYA
jgi:hypothetical protein